MRGIKVNKALIKDENLKGLLGYPTYKLFGCMLVILKIEKDLLNRFSRPTTEDEEQFERIEERPQLEDRFRGLLTVSWTRGYSHVVSQSGGSGRGPPWRFTIGPVRTAHAAYKEDSTRLGDQDKDSSPPTYSTRTLVILGLWYVI